MKAKRPLVWSPAKPHPAKAGAPILPLVLLSRAALPARAWRLRERLPRSATHGSLRSLSPRRRKKRLRRLPEALGCDLWAGTRDIYVMGGEMPQTSRCRKLQLNVVVFLHSRRSLRPRLRASAGGQPPSPVLRGRAPQGTWARLPACRSLDMAAGPLGEVCGFASHLLSAVARAMPARPTRAMRSDPAKR